MQYMEKKIRKGLNYCFFVGFRERPTPHVYFLNKLVFGVYLHLQARNQSAISALFLYIVFPMSHTFSNIKWKRHYQYL